MNRLIRLELKRNGLRSYHVAVMISTVIMLGLIYLMVLIPKIDPAEADMAVFMNYNTLISPVIFLIIGSVAMIFTGNDIQKKVQDMKV